jgi:cytochrome c oxidase subunit III
MVTELLEKRAPGVSGPRPPRGGDEGRDGGDGRKEPGSPSPGILGDPARFGLLVFLGTVTMLFIGFTSAYILRRTAADWRPLLAPPVLWANTVALVLSSVLLERARRRLRGWDLRGAQAAFLATGILGALFVLGQVVGWRQLSARGLFLSSNPHSSFFYVLTGVHAVHLLGGLAWFAALLVRFRRMSVLPGEDGLRQFATYWHFLGGLWIYLLWLLFVY